MASADLSGLVQNGATEFREELLAKPHMPVSALLMRYQTAFRMMGLTNPRKQLLGKGNFGVAYEIDLDGEPSVLKLTRDPYEVLSSYSLQGETTEHIVPIYRVWSCMESVPGGRRGQAWLGWFVVHRDILRLISKNDAKLLEFLYALYMDENIDLWVPKVGSPGRSMRDKWRLYIKESYSGQMVERAMSLLDDVSLGVREMSKHGIDWADMHSENMMRDRKGVLRIADVGFGIPRRNFETTPPEFTVEAVEKYLAALQTARA